MKSVTMNSLNSISGIRKIYQLQILSESDVLSDPILQFQVWWQQAMKSGIDEPNAMVLSTATASAWPSSRVVLLKGIDENGFTFFTNYNSRKSREILENPHVSLLFFWKELERQIRIEGTISRTSTEVSDEYFASRPLESRIGAWSSPQSNVIENRKFLQQNEQKYTLQFENGNIPRPEFWGGFIVAPHCIEFWQGRPGRLHDRLQYIYSENEKWKIERLAP